jgi:hypothetical protein
MAVTDYDAPQAVHAALSAIRIARIKAGEAIGRNKTALAEADAAHKEHLSALEDAARGTAGADQRAEDARARRTEALERAAEARLADEAARRVIRSEQARIHQIRMTHWAEFSGEAENSVDEVRKAAEALLGPLRQYLHAWQQAAAKWSTIGPSTQAQILENDRAAGRYRDQGAVYDDASLPPCPIDYSAVNAVLTVMPRPRFLGKSAAPASDEPEVLDVDLRRLAPKDA